MAEPSIIKSTANPEVNALYHRNQVATPQSCVDVSGKVSNIRRQIAALDEMTQARMEINRKIAFGNRAILIAGIVQDTCVAFLDLGRQPYSQ